MREAFDALTQFSNHNSWVKYPGDFFGAITNCLATAGNSLYPAASNAAWKGWTQYGIDGGAPGDSWNVNNTAGWKEYNPRNLTYDGHEITVIEPCNMISNLAYYRIVPDMCANRGELRMGDDRVNAIIQGFATLGMGSSLYHASRTDLGDLFDNTPIGVISYTYQQLMTGSLTPVGNATKTVLQDLSTIPRQDDAIELAWKLHTIPLEQGLHEWRAAVRGLDVPGYYMTFAAIVINCLSLIAPDAINDKLIPLAMSVFGISHLDQKFLMQTYLPALRGALAGVPMTFEERAALVPKMLGTLMKLLYAFIWQEHLVRYGALYNPVWNLCGALLIPSVNSLCNKLTGFGHADFTIQHSTDVYPAHSYCKIKATAPHAKWHEQSANGLMDLAYLADTVRSAIDDAQARSPSVSSAGPSSTDVVLTADIIDSWLAEIEDEKRSEASTTRRVFAEVVRDIATSMDGCTSGEADGTINWEELTCYVSGVGSFTGFIDDLFAGLLDRDEGLWRKIHSHVEV